MFLSPHDDDPYAQRSRSYRWLQKANLLVSTAAIFLIGLWALAYHFWFKDIYVPSKAPLHVSQSITLSEGVPRGSRIPITVKFSITNSADNTAYLLPGAFIARGITFKKRKMRKENEDKVDGELSLSLRDVLNRNKYYKIIFRENGPFINVNDKEDNDYIWFTTNNGCGYYLIPEFKKDEDKEKYKENKDVLINKENNSYEIYYIPKQKDEPKQEGEYASITIKDDAKNYDLIHALNETYKPGKFSNQICQNKNIIEKVSNIISSEDGHTPKNNSYKIVFKVNDEGKLPSREKCDDSTQDKEKSNVYQEEFMALPEFPWCH